MVRLIVLTIVALFGGVFAVLFIARWRIYPHTPLGDIARIPLVVVAGQSLAYLLILGYMYVLVTRERGRPDFLAAIHWNWPSNIARLCFGRLRRFRWRCKVWPISCRFRKSCRSTVFSTHPPKLGRSVS